MGAVMTGRDSGRLRKGDVDKLLFQLMARSHLALGLAPKRSRAARCTGLGWGNRNGVMQRPWGKRDRCICGISAPLFPPGDNPVNLPCPVHSWSQVLWDPPGGGKFLDWVCKRLHHRLPLWELLQLEKPAPGPGVLVKLLVSLELESILQSFLPIFPNPRSTHIHPCEGAAVGALGEK